jgi:Aldo/keto reductase family
MTHIDTAELYGGAQRRNWWAKRSPGGATRFSLSRRCFPSVPLAVRNTPGVRAITRPSQYTAWTVTCCIGVAGTYSRIRLQGSKIFGARARFSWGVSNFGVPDLREVLAIAGEGEGRLACNQVLYNLQDRAIELAVLPWCEGHRVAVTGYNPFGHGNFPDSRSPGGRVLADIGEFHDATPRHVALAFLTRRPSLFTIPKASTPAPPEENAGAGDLQLSDAEIALIDSAFPRGPRPRTLPVL